ARRRARSAQIPSTVTVVLIQGWMPHSNRYVPGARLIVNAGAPTGTNDASVAAGNGIVNSGIGSCDCPGKTKALRKGTKPGPNAATIVNVCVSPPVLISVSGVPALIVV